MNLILSKIIRRYMYNNIPYTCYANQYLPKSLNEICDCDLFCKFPPKGNTLMSIMNFNDELQKKYYNKSS